MGNMAVSSMSIPRIQAPQSNLPFGEEANSGFRTKTAATRLTPTELVEIEAAAEGKGQAVSEWLRQTALRAARQRPADPSELVLAEVWAVRYALLNFFHAAAQAASEGRQLSPDSILKIRDQADTRKLQQARKLLEEFLTREDKEPGRTPWSHAFSRKFFAADTSAMGSRDVLFAAGGAEYVAEPVRIQTAGHGDDRMGQTSAKFARKMADEDGRNSIQTEGTCGEADPRDCAETNATGSSHRFRRSAEETRRPARAPALRFDHGCAQWQTQRGVCLGGDEGNRMRDRLPRIRLHA